MKRWAIWQTNLNGGHPAPIGMGFEDGEKVFVVSRDEILELLDDLRHSCSGHYFRLPEILDLLREEGSYTRNDGRLIDTSRVGLDERDPDL